MSRLERPRFDPGADFFVTKSFKIDGKQFTPGEPFDKALVNQRLLRQLYEATRKIDMVEKVSDPAA